MVDLLSRVDNPIGIIDRLRNTPGEEANAARLDAIRPYAEQAETAAVQAPQPSFIANLVPFIVAPLLIVIVGVIVAIVYGMFIAPNLVEPLQKRLRGEKVSEEVIAMRHQVQASRQAMESQRTDFTATTQGPPLMQRMSTYILGHGQYDDSFSIEDENERFLGESGAGISETIGVGEPQKATAIEVWLFDKDDFVRTITKVFASEHAFNDPALRAKLEPKGDLVLAQPGATVMLETASLRLQARIVELEYGTGPLPPRSYFQKLTIELAAWRKDVPGAPATVTTVTTSAPAAPPPAAFAPPPAPVTAPPPAPQAAPPSSGFQPAPSRFGSGASPAMRPPAAPPPASPLMSPPPAPPSADDDPFGGTGDFTPIS
jgi:hypothetical protein